jgi:hypothetical protein
MKQIMEALGKAVQALLSAKTLWFLLIVTAGVSVFLLAYFNDGLMQWRFLAMGCDKPGEVTPHDVLGLCQWTDHKNWVGLTAIITIFSLIASLLFRLWTALQTRKPAVAPEPKK